MNFNKWEIKRIRQALCLAIEYEESVIESYLIRWDKRTILPKMCLSKDKENIKDIKRMKRNVSAFRNLLKNLKK